jgi:DNA-binding protein H-NS
MIARNTETPASALPSAAVKETLPKSYARRAERRSGVYRCNALLTKSAHNSRIFANFALRKRFPMARARAPENMTYAELTQLRGRVDRLLVAKKNEARVELREKIANLVSSKGMTLEDVLGGKRGQRKGTVAVKYRDPKDPANTWTGRGRMPRWLVAATKGRKAKREDFAV